MTAKDSAVSRKGPLRKHDKKRGLHLGKRLLRVPKVSPKMEARIVEFAALGLLSATSRNSAPRLYNVFASRLGLVRSCVPTWLVCRLTALPVAHTSPDSDPGDHSRDVPLPSSG